jgi:DNA-binding Lrp family transcriptional regulator
MKLGEREQRILNIIQQSSNLSVADIAREVGAQHHTVRNILSLFQEELGLIQYTPINTCALGFTEYHVSIGLSGLTMSTVEKLLSRLQESDRVSLVIELAGRYQCGIWAMNQRQLGDILDGLLGELPGVTVSGINVRQWFRGFGLFLGSPRSFAGYTLAPGSKTEVIDELDHAILRELSARTNDCAASLARVTGKPLSTINYRLKQLQEKQIVLPAVYLLPLQKAGLTRGVFHLQTSSGPAVREQLIRYCRETNHVVALAEVTGAWTFEVTAALSTAASPNTFIDSLARVLGSNLLKAEFELQCDLVKIDNYPFKSWPFES